MAPFLAFPALLLLSTAGQLSASASLTDDGSMDVLGPADLLAAAEHRGASMPSPRSMPMTELEAEVQRTSHVAAFLAQDAALLSKELHRLQSSLRGRKESAVDRMADSSLNPDALPSEMEGTALSALETEAASGAKSWDKAEPTLAAVPPPPATATAPAAPAPAGASEEGCGGSEQPTCSGLTRILTFDYRYTVNWGMANWVLTSILAFMVLWCCGACCYRRG
mmetsp:Transcript_70243/g.113280  ORF Transcript_70243/g.113280 Transcript_70243/m.113280 type:complete len:223 (-) Transcript_70243:74-742(-)